MNTLHQRLFQALYNGDNTHDISISLKQEYLCNGEVIILSITKTQMLF